MEFKYALLDDISYRINESNKTAEVDKIGKSSVDVIIPRTIIYNSQNYTVTRILGSALFIVENVKSVKFQLFSQVRIFDYQSFANKSIESITIPSSVTEIRGGWCSNALNLKEIKIMPTNPRYTLINKKIIIGKSKIGQLKYDTVVFAMNNIETVKIPNYIKIIGTHAFNCCKIKNFEFLQPSKLETIEDCAFYKCNIKSIQIPDTVKHIGKEAFSFCDILEKIEFSNSKIQCIEVLTFNATSIMNLKIPPSVTIIKKNAFANTYHLRSLEIPSNSQLKKIESSSFTGSAIERLTIPSKFDELEDGWNFEAPQISDIVVMPDNPYFVVYENKFLLRKSSKEKDIFDALILYFGKDETVLIPDFVEIICTFAFNECKQIRRIETSINSKLRIIKTRAFNETSIETIILPSSLIELQKTWCYNSPNLNEIKVMPGNMIFQTYNNAVLVKKSSISNESYDVLVQAYQNIVTLKIHDDIEIIEPFAFYNCNKLKTIEFSHESKLRIIGDFSFYHSSIEYFSLPSHVTSIGEFAFRECQHIKKFEIPFNSELEIIGKYAFSDSLIKQIYIPNSLTTICESAFICSLLEKVEFSENSKLQIIGKNAFHQVLINSIFIPSNVEKIEENAFDCSCLLQKVDFSKNSKLKTIESSVFDVTSIKSICLPKNLKEIDIETFKSCYYLQIIEFNDILDIKNYTYILCQFQSDLIIMVPAK